MKSKIVVFIALLGVGQYVSAGFGMTSHQITRTISQNISKNIFERMVPKLKVKNSSGKVYQLDISNKGRFLSLLLEDNSTRVWDLELGIQRPTIKSDTKVIASSLDEKHELIYLLNNHSLVSYDILTAQKKNTLPLRKVENISGFHLINKGRKVLLTHDVSLSLFDLDSKKKEWSQKSSEGEIRRVISDEGRGKWISLVSTTSIFSSNDWLEVGGLRSGKNLYKLENDGNKVIFFGFVQNKLSVGYDSGEIINWDVNSGQKGVALALKHQDIKLMDISSNGSIVYLNDNNELVVTNMEQKNSHTLAMESKNISQLSIMDDGKTVLTADEEGKVLFWTTAGGQFLQLISTTEGWTVVDKIGRFDSSEKGMVNISWQVTDANIPLDSFSTSYYEPGLLAAHLQDRGFINTSPSNVSKGISAPPLVKIIEPDKNIGREGVVLHVTGQGVGEIVDDIRLYHNGKANNKGVVTSKKIKRKIESPLEMDFEVTLLTGTNTFKAVAVNSIGIEGTSEEIVINVDGERSLPTIHVLSIGINEYSDPNLNLNYSVADADKIAKIISDKNLKEYKEVKHHSLNNKEATKDNILGYLGSLKHTSSEDVLIVYAAGHGIAIDKKWYFLPYETTSKKNESEYAEVGISAKEFKDVLVVNKAQKIFVIIDSCFSSAGLAAFRDLENTQRHFSRLLSKSVGIVVLTAAKYNQKAEEDSGLGHGLFTYVVTKGMGGLADRKPVNKRISAHEISEFTVETTPILSRQYMGAIQAQEPSSFVIGSDFELLGDW